MILKISFHIWVRVEGTAAVVSGLNVFRNAPPPPHHQVQSYRVPAGGELELSPDSSGNLSLFLSVHLYTSLVKERTGEGRSWPILKRTQTCCFWLLS